MSFIEDFNDGGTIEVAGPSGEMLRVLTDGEAEWVTRITTRYMSDNHFSNITDLQDLDRILVMEMLSRRWGIWLAQEHDYEGSGVDLEKLQKYMSDYSKEIRLLKKSLGIDKAARDRDKGDSPAEYINNLRIRAKEFGIMRNDQFAKVITLFQELISLITLHNNCDDYERKENNIEIEDILDWIERMAIPEFQAIDATFRETKQKMWIRSQ